MSQSSDNITVNGYMLREALKRWERKRTLASRLFNDSFYSFEGETKPSPIAVMDQFQQADSNYARLQEIQQRYNNYVTVNIQGETISLSLAVKLIGGAGRIEKMWHESLAPKRGRYSYDDRAETTRSKDTIYAERTLSERDCMSYAEKASRYAADLRSAIAQANATAVPIHSPAFQDRNGHGISSAEFLNLISGSDEPAA